MENKKVYWENPSYYERVPHLLPFQPTLLKHIANKNLVRLYRKNIPASNTQVEQNMYQWRNKTQYPLIKVMYMGIHKQNIDQLIPNFEIYVQAAKNTLENLQNLNVEQILYIFKTTLYAMGKLIEKFGCYAITDKMIIINYQDQCKVWVNENLEENRVAWPVDSEQIMVKQLVKVLESHSDASHSNYSFFKMAQNMCSSIPKAYNFLTKFTYESKTLIPPSIMISENNVENKQKNRHLRSLSNARFVKNKEQSYLANNSSYRQFSQAQNGTKSTLKRNMSFHSRQNSNPSLNFDFRKRQISNLSLFGVIEEHNPKTKIESQTDRYPIVISNKLQNKAGSGTVQAKLTARKSQFYSTNQSSKQSNNGDSHQLTHTDKMKTIIKQKMKNKAGFFQSFLKPNNQQSLLSSQYYCEQTEQQTESQKQSKIFIDFLEESDPS